jgi:hypothetical protein
VPAVAATFQSLELIQEWLQVHISILERWEARKSFEFG